MRLWRQIGTQLRLGNLRWLLLEFHEGKMIVSWYGGRVIVLFGSPHMIDGDVLANIQRET